MTETDIMQQLRDMRYPGTIDVVEHVMEQVPRAAHLCQLDRIFDTNH